MPTFAGKEMRERLAKIKEHALSIASLSQEADQAPIDATEQLMDLIENDVAAIKVYVNGVRLELEQST